MDSVSVEGPNIEKILGVRIISSDAVQSVCSLILNTDDEEETANGDSGAEELFSVYEDVTAYGCTVVCECESVQHKCPRGCSGNRDEEGTTIATDSVNRTVLEGAIVNSKGRNGIHCVINRGATRIR